MTLAWIWLGRDGTGQRAHLKLAVPDEEVVFLFDGRRLADATEAARAMLPRSGSGIDDWGEFLLGFGHRFDDLENRILNLPQGQPVALRINDSGKGPETMSLEAERNGDLLRIVLKEQGQATQSELVERYSMMAMRAELETLRAIAELSPVLTWKQRDDGAITWANAAYMALAETDETDKKSLSWPPPDIFASVPAQRGSGASQRRVASQPPGRDKEHWFDLTTIQNDSCGKLNFAAPADALVRAERALSGFVQTLTKTFAHLTIGLAIFDRRRRLVLFNPALVDLTGVPAEQLSTQPTLHSFLDALRDRQRIPEPKDYKSWRLHIAQLEAGAEEGTYAQTWYLATGQTYRVTGRPHPDGAVAYVFEDITSEVSLTRSFRSEIQMSQSILDNLDDAIAIFSHNGVLSASNRIYEQMWQACDCEDAPSVGVGVGLADAVQRWQARSSRPDLWGPVRLGLIDGQMRQSFDARVTAPDGTGLLLRTRLLTGGACMVSFEHNTQQITTDVPRLSRVGT
ncbi:MAG: PAS-domain containing protein [Qingshengfaniella sp.]